MTKPLNVVRRFSYAYLKGGEENGNEKAQHNTEA